MKKGSDIAGIIPPAVTPFMPDGTISEELFRAEVRHLIDSGVHGISPGGSTGEGAALTDEELRQLVTWIRADNKKGLPIVAGVIRASTQAAVTTAQAAKEAGADALMITPTFYNILVPDAEGNCRFYQTLSDAVGLPIIIYNVVPQNEISPELFERLLDIKHVVGIKQSLGGPMACYDQIRTNGQRGMIYSATDEMIATTFALGTDGAISAILSLFPDLCMRMWDLTQDGKSAEAQAIQDELFPLWKIIRGPQFPARMKMVMKLLGRDRALPRSPLHEADASFKEKVSPLLEAIRTKYSNE